MGRGRERRRLARASTAGDAALLAGAATVVLVVLGVVWSFERADALWLDETWTGAIAATRGWGDAYRQIYWDVNAPLYYVVAKLWATVAGVSDTALRAPSLVCAALTAPAIVLAPMPGLMRQQRLAWGALVAFWFPALCFAAEARCYALLLLVSAVQTLAFGRLLARPTLQRAALWAALASVAILTHYDALYLGAAQGVVYLARWRRAAVRTWPAALAFLPAFAWLAYHAPRIRAFAAPAIAWYAPLQASELHAVLAYAAGAAFQLDMFAALALSALSLRLVLTPSRNPGPEEGRGAAGLTAATSLLAAVMLVCVGFLRPSFTFRYMTPEAPGLMLGVVLVARLLAGRRAVPITLLACVVGALASSVWMLGRHQRMAPRRYNFEVASRFIAAARPARLVFLWDHPVDPVLHREQLAALGGFFLERVGLRTEVEPIVLRAGEDPNARLAAAAAGQDAGRPAAVLWLYDTWVHGTAARAHSPDFARLAPRDECRDFGAGRFGVVACRPSAHQPGVSQPHGGG